MEYTFGWTTDPRILEIVGELWGTGDELLSNRKDGGIHRVWVWPLGHFDDDLDPYSNDEPIFTRVDAAYGRYLSDGCTFLVWDDESVRAGTVEDAEWLLKGVNQETRRTRAAAERASFSKLLILLQGAATSPSPISTASVAVFIREAEAYREDAHRWKMLSELLDKLGQKTMFARPVPPYTLKP